MVWVRQRAPPTLAFLIPYHLFADTTIARIVLLHQDTVLSTYSAKGKAPSHSG